jgi:diketogulonate reductase-like aldo/keto reductase
VREWIIQRPARIWIETTVKADTLEDALEVADKEISNGEFTEVDESWEVNWDEFWAKDDKGETFG